MSEPDDEGKVRNCRDVVFHADSAYFLVNKINNEAVLQRACTSGQLMTTIITMQITKFLFVCLFIHEFIQKTEQLFRRTNAKTSF